MKAMINSQSVVRCAICGKFIGFKEFQKSQIRSHYTPDSEYTIEDLHHTHKKCEKKNDKI